MPGGPGQGPGKARSSGKEQPLSLGTSSIMCPSSQPRPTHVACTAGSVGHVGSWTRLPLSPVQWAHPCWDPSVSEPYLSTGPEPVTGVVCVCPWTDVVPSVEAPNPLPVPPSSRKLGAPIVCREVQSIAFPVPGLPWPSQRLVLFVQTGPLGSAPGDVPVSSAEDPGPGHWGHGAGRVGWGGHGLGSSHGANCAFHSGQPIKFY